MAASPVKLAGQPDLVADDEPDSAETEQHPQPLPRRHALAEPAARDRDRDDRLQPDQHRRGAGGHPGGERDEHAAKVDAVHEPRRDRHVRRPAPACRATVRAIAIATSVISAATSAKRYRRKVSGGAYGQPVFRRDEAGAPQQHEQPRESRLPARVGGLAHRNRAPRGSTARWRIRNQAGWTRDGRFFRDIRCGKSPAPRRSQNFGFGFAAS